MKFQPQYTQADEKFHSMTHAIGAILAFVGFVLLVWPALQHGDVWRILSFSIYGGSLILLYLASTLYHGVREERRKRLFRHLDHLSIFLLIAGSYTPVALLSLHGIWRWTIFGLIWGFAAAGIVYEWLFLGRYKWITVTIYLGMGWLAVVAIKPLLTMVPLGLLGWLLAGGLFYTGGVVFYVRKRMRYHHVLWHLFVLFGSACHFLGFFFYLA